MQNICVGKQKFLLIPPFEEVYKTHFKLLRAAMVVLR